MSAEVLVGDKKEVLALMSAIQYFSVYIPPTRKLMIYTDHNPLVFLDRMQNKNQNLMRWALQLKAVQLEIRHLRGKLNLVADVLSRVDALKGTNGGERSWNV